MKEQIQVSIIVVTYNSDIRALRATMDSIVNQKDVIWEVIITDDGSAQKDFSWLPEYFHSNHVQKYKILENQENKGTVRNYLIGVREAVGEYIFGISPGDMLFDKHVLADFYKFAKQGNKKICFGNSVYYSNDKEGMQYHKKCIAPRNPEIYAQNAWMGKLNFFSFDWICGVAYFRHREAAISYIEKAAECCKYVEDSSSTAYALANGERVWYYDRNIAWYETGSGISTSGSSKWNKILAQEYKNTFLRLRELYPRDRMIQFASIVYMGIPQWKIRFRKLLQHPILTAANVLFLPKRKQKELVVTSMDVEYLKRLLSGEKI